MNTDATPAAEPEDDRLYPWMPRLETMKPTTRLSLLIVLAALLPTLAIIGVRMDERAAEAGVVELRIRLLCDMGLHTRDETTGWLREHPGHPLAGPVSRALHPDLSTQIRGGTSLETLLRAVGE